MLSFRSWVVSGCACGLALLAVALNALAAKHHVQCAGLDRAAGRQIYRSECAGLLDVDGAARPAPVAHAAMAWLLDDADPAVMAGGTATMGPAPICPIATSPEAP